MRERRTTASCVVVVAFLVLVAPRAIAGEADVGAQELASLKAQLALYRSQVKKKASQAAELRKEMAAMRARLEAEKTQLQGQLAKSQKRIAELQATVNAMAKKEGAKPIPLTGDEASVLDMRTNRRKFLDKVVVLCGALKPENYYNYGYDNAEKTHFCLEYDELQGTQTCAFSGSNT